MWHFSSGLFHRLAFVSARGTEASKARAENLRYFYSMHSKTPMHTERSISSYFIISSLGAQARRIIFLILATNTTTTMMTASQQPISAVAVSSSDAKRKDDICRQNPEDVRGLKVRDPFLYYSNDKIRMRELRLRLQDIEYDSSDDDSSDEGSFSSSLSNQEQSMATCERKTRITFELHPSLVLEDLMKDLFDDDLDVSLHANEQDSCAVDGDMNGLRQIILG